MKRCYHKTDTHFTQLLSIEINANVNTIMSYLSTSKGIQQWFPQLSFHQEGNQKVLLFNMNETSIQMSVLDETNDTIAFTWGEGTVTLQVIEQHDFAELKLTEVMPVSYDMLVKDFTGWLCQMDNIKYVSETGNPLPLDMSKFHKEQDILHGVLKDFEI